MKLITWVVVPWKLLILLCRLTEHTSAVAGRHYPCAVTERYGRRSFTDTIWTNTNSTCNTDTKEWESKRPWTWCFLCSRSQWNSLQNIRSSHCWKGNVFLNQNLDLMKTVNYILPQSSFSLHLVFPSPLQLPADMKQTDSLRNEIRVVKPMLLKKFTTEYQSWILCVSMWWWFKYSVFLYTVLQWIWWFWPMRLWHTSIPR